MSILDYLNLPYPSNPIATFREDIPPYLKEAVDKLEKRGPCASQYIVVHQCQAEKWPKIPHKPDLKHGRPPESLGPSVEHYKVCMKPILDYERCKEVSKNAEWYKDTFMPALFKLAEKKQRDAIKAEKTTAMNI